MEVIINTQKNPYSIPNVLTELLSNKNFALFDIETTGLNPSYDKVILIGVLYQEEDNIIIKQFFCNNSSEELELLKSFIETFRNFDIYVTFNGGNFDIPFLNKRFSKYGLNYQIDPYNNLDLLKVVRKNKALLGLSNCKLKTVEKFLGINRQDTIDGAESVRLFKRYEQTRDENLKEKILLHNFEDILHLFPTLNIVNYIDKDRVFTHFPKEFSLNDQLTIRVEDYKLKKDFLEVFGSFFGSINQDFIFYNPNYEFSILRDENRFKFKVPLLSVNIENNESYSFINLNELNYKKSSLADMDNNEKMKYLVKIGNEIKDFNVFNFIKDFSLHVLREIYK